MTETKRSPRRGAYGASTSALSAAVPLSMAERVMGMTVTEARDRHSYLTERQRQVAEEMARGLTNRQIAEELGISPKTLDIHRADVFDKLEVKTSAAVASIVFLVALGEAVGEP